MFVYRSSGYSYIKRPQIDLLGHRHRVEIGNLHLSTLWIAWKGTGLAFPQPLNAEVANSISSISRWEI